MEKRNERVTNAIDVRPFVSARKSGVDLPISATYNGRYLYLKTRTTDLAGNIVVITHRIDVTSICAIWSTLRFKNRYDRR